MLSTVFDWWLNLWTRGLGGPIFACFLAVFVALAVGNAVVWTLTGIKFVGRAFADGYRRGASRKPSEPTIAPADTASG